MRLFKKIWKRRKGKWALCILIFFGVMALCADFIANEKPIYCKYEGESYFPIFHQYGESLGITNRYQFLGRTSWQDLSLEKAIYPIIKFNANSIDSQGTSFLNPGTKITSFHIIKTHWLGADGIGRDVAAGIVQGSRKTIFIAVISMLIACIIGIGLGLIAGYFGDDSLSINVWLLMILVMGLSFFFFQWIYGHWSFLTMKACAVTFTILVFILNKNFSKSQIKLPLDILIMRAIEIFKSVPALFILLALLAVISKPSILNLVLILGILRWTTIARVLRAELLKLKAKDFVHAARALGLSNFQIIRRHIMPNVLPPLLTIIAFGFASVILLEATISFLGIGLGAEDVTWGSILSEARTNFSAWWLAVFPGLAIFLMVIACNYLGDTINETSLKSI